MNAINVVVVLIVSTLAVGCASFDKQKDETAGLLNPPKLHGAHNKENPAHKASIVPIDDYYHALDLAKSTYTVDPTGKTTGVVAADQEKIKNYVSEGIGLTDTYCRRWFHGLEDMHRLLAFQNKNINVISQLGTALLGIGNANAAIVAAYGASNTAYAGFSENFNSAFLVAPTAAKVKEHIESVMKAEALQLRADSASLNFKQAYIRLERYAGLCTHARAKEIVDSALDLTKTQLNASTSQPETVKK